MSQGRPGDGTHACLAVVRRGELEVFRTLKQELEEPDVVEVIWDRRVGERRAAKGTTPGSERRRRERRLPPPPMWTDFGFVVASRTNRATPPETGGGEISPAR